MTSITKPSQSFAVALLSESREGLPLGLPDPGVLVTRVSTHRLVDASAIAVDASGTASLVEGSKVDLPMMLTPYVARGFAIFDADGHRVGGDELPVTRIPAGARPVLRLDEMGEVELTVEVSP